MKDLILLVNESYEILNSLNIPYYDRNFVNFKWNGRISTKWGYCRKVNNGFEISICSRLGEDDIKRKKILSVILHEILHTCPGCFNHGAQWKTYGKLIKINYGIKIKKESSAEELNVPYKYILKCKNCKTKYYYAMKPRLTNKKCKICNSNNFKFKELE